ncbi:MAG: hypothetical protein IPJ77_06000 [Planctomycetes bacterium]|nr:hypothetical protein [Planctomycetota bacterium]
MSTSHRHLRIGIDIGRVLVESDTDPARSFFGANFLDARAIPGAFEAVAALARLHGAESIHLVSKCSPSTQVRTRQWLAHHAFHAQTGVPPEQVHFCLQRHAKRALCDAHGLTAFVDDRFSVLEHLLHLEHLYLFRPLPRERAAWAASPHRERVRLAEAWERAAFEALWPDG